MLVVAGCCSVGVCWKEQLWLGGEVVVVASALVTAGGRAMDRCLARLLLFLEP